ncbi:MAG TPA: hypothetical protein VEQ58_21430 [Polyangiaceae bacterium]|nr:hypothetical protein [Polyangiaceae bacterium]
MGSGQSITLLVGAPVGGGTPAIRVTYVGSKGSGKVDGAAL